MISSELLEYIVDFLLGPIYVDGKEHSAETFPFICYTDKEEEMRDALVVIKPAPFFQTKVYGTAQAEPTLPLAEWEGVPLLYGSPHHEWINEGKTLLLHADLIASTYFLMSRYEEMTHRGERDSLGRFPHSSSLLSRAGLLHRPIIDEYAVKLRAFLQRHDVLSRLGISLADQTPTFSRINLTHNIGKPFKYRGFMGICRGIFRDKQSPLSVIRMACSQPNKDPYYTFDQIFSLNKSVSDNYHEQVKVQSVLFFKVPSRNSLDKPNYYLSKPYMYQVLSEADKLGAIFGLLCSHNASYSPSEISEELKRLRTCLKKVYVRLYQWQKAKGKSRTSHAQGQEPKCVRDLDLIRSRHASLALNEPEDTRDLILAGIRHDYSMAYSDALGFRLGTCRAVRAINPNTRALTDLVHHPLTICDSQLLALVKQGLSEEEIYQLCIQQIDVVYQLGGELNLLWHSEHFVASEYPYLGSIYQRICAYIITLSPKSKEVKEQE